MRKIEENSKRKTRNVSKLINPSHLKKTRTFQFSSNSKILIQKQQTH